MLLHLGIPLSTTVKTHPLPKPTSLFAHVPKKETPPFPPWFLGHLCPRLPLVWQETPLAKEYLISSDKSLLEVLVFTHVGKEVAQQTVCQELELQPHQRKTPRNQPQAFSTDKLSGP